MNVQDAAYATVHDYPGGSIALGPRVGINAAVLRNKVNPNNPGNQLTLAEADRVMGVTGDLRILQALAAEHGCVLQQVTEQGGEASLTERLLDETAACGTFAGELRAALADGVISENEMRTIGEAGLAEQTVMIGLLRSLLSATGKRLHSVSGSKQA